MRPSKTFDKDLLCKDADLVAASGAATVDGVAKVLHIGKGNYRADLVVDVSACEVDTGDEKYTVQVQVSSDENFASDVFVVAELPLGDAAVLGGDTDMVEGRYILPFENRVGDGETREYMRVYTVVAGTIVTGINYTAFVGK